MLHREGRLPKVLDGVVEPASEKLLAVIHAANLVPTTLWFESDEPEQLPNLVVAGHATVVFNLMKFIIRNYGRDQEAYPDEVRAGWSTLCAEWRDLNEDPFRFVGEN